MRLSALRDIPGMSTDITRMAVPSQLSPGSNAGMPAIKVSTLTVGKGRARVSDFVGGGAKPSENNGLHASEGIDANSMTMDKAVRRI
jgi:hypothetical protein